ncbi:MAG: hypothetical protein GQ549_06420 [Gammaproteobacteria bacterium]|nr:hypothetical protein [Gammaproteobacteria bacterium]
MNKPLKQSVRDHLKSYSLNEKQLQKLEALSEQAIPEAKHQFSILPFAVVGAVAVFLLAFLLTPLIMDQNDISQSIAMEVASNHIKLKPLEIETSSIDGIRGYFKKLDFMPINSKLVNALELELIGGRYCSLQGITAAQLRLKKPGSNTIQTLYQTEYRKDVFENMPQLDDGDKPVDIYVKGIKVKIWVEKDLLFALTEPPESQTQN